MSRFVPAVTVFLMLAAASVVSAAPTTQPSTRPSEASASTPPVLQFHMQSLDGKDVDLAQYKGKVILMVNTASKCGYTPQYAPLEAIYKKYADQGFVILGFPANDFHQQEPGTNEEISTFCTKNYGVTFPMFSKVDVIGPNTCDLYKYLTSESSDAKFAGPVKWNFEKFLIGRDGTIVARYRSKIRPESLEVTQAIEAELAKQP